MLKLQAESFERIDDNLLLRNTTGRVVGLIVILADEYRENERQRREQAEMSGHTLKSGRV